MKGYRCIFTMPDKMSQEKARLLRALGAEVIITPTAVPRPSEELHHEGTSDSPRRTPTRSFADQHYNPVNPEVHIARRVRAVGANLREDHALRMRTRTGGTVSGSRRFLKEKNPRSAVIAGDPAGSIYTDMRALVRRPRGHP